MPLRLLLAAALCAAGFTTALAQPKLYPASAEVIDLTQPPYNADPTGATDASGAINQAFLDHNDEHEILYLPAGTYLVTDTVRWGNPAGCGGRVNQNQCNRYTVLAGAGSDVTTIQLADDLPAFQPGACGERGCPVVFTDANTAQNFENSLRHLTVSTGAGNGGATGVYFQANNTGGIYDVGIRSEDGAGKIGLDLRGGGENGPLLVRDVSVTGFDRGINAYANQNSLTLEDIALAGQNETGIYNQQQVTTIRRLQSDNAVTAIVNQQDGGSTLTLLDAELRNTGIPGENAAIVNGNGRALFLRDVVTTDYEVAVDERVGGSRRSTVPDGVVEEYFAGEATRACDNVARSLDLPVVETPEIVYADTADWIDVEDYGAAINAQATPGAGSAADDTEEIQAALDAAALTGAGTVVFPSPRAPFPAQFHAYGDLVVPAGVRHLIGAKTRIGGEWTLVVAEGTERLVVEDFVNVSSVRHSASRELQFERSTVRDYVAVAGAGDVHLADVNGGPFAFVGQDVYARQLNVENDTVNVTNDGGRLWILGLKTEKDATVIRTTGGGATEVLGALVYKQTAEATGATPIFEVVDASLSVAGFKELNYNGTPYTVKLRETRGGVTAEVVDSTGELRTSLLAAFVPATAVNAAPSVDAGADQLIVAPTATVALAAAVNDDGLAGGDCFASTTWSLVSGPAAPAFADAGARATEVTLPVAGEYVLELAASDGALTTRDTVVVAAYDAFSTTLDHDQDGTPSGRGADAALYADGGRTDDNYGADSLLAVRNASTFARKAILRIDRAAFADPVDGARLELEIATKNTGLIDAWTYNVFGLDDGAAGESWVEGDGIGRDAVGDEVTWANAPGNAPGVNGGAYDATLDEGGGADPASTTFLGTFTLRAGARERVGLATVAPRDFVNADTDGQLTFLVTRVESTANLISFAAKENVEFAAPTLYYDFAADAPLPVELLAFGARAAGDDVDVSWSVASEVDVVAYTVEHSPDGRAFAWRGEVDAGSPTGEYRFYDDGPGAGAHYYRLVPRGPAGHEPPSETVVVRLEPAGARAYALAPNPAPGARAVRLVPTQPFGPAGARVTVSDPAGRQLATYDVAGERADFELPVGTLPAGNYLVSVASGGRVEHLWLVR